MISMIAAIDNNGYIGLKGDMPWGNSMKSDLKRFKQLTADKVIIMGRKTFDSLPRILPNRHHFVISRQNFQIRSPYVRVMNFEAALESAQYDPDDEMFVIGGAEIYKQFMPYADKIYLTRILADLEGDTKFPEITGDWDIAEGALFHFHGEPYGTQYVTYTRRG